MSEDSEVSLTAKPGGPLVIKGQVKVIAADGSEKAHDTITALCRCGASANKPYCDGAHRELDFE